MLWVKFSQTEGSEHLYQIWLLKHKTIWRKKIKRSLICSIVSTINQATQTGLFFPILGSGRTEAEAENSLQETTQLKVHSIERLRKIASTRG